MTENAAVSWQMHPQHWGEVDSVTFHAQRNASGETQSAQYSIALFVASDAKDIWQCCSVTVTQGCVRLWSEPAVSDCSDDRTKGEVTVCLRSSPSSSSSPLPLLHLSFSASSTTSTHYSPPPHHHHTLCSSTMPALTGSIFTSTLTHPPFLSPSPPCDQGWVTAVTAWHPPPLHSTHRQMHAQTSTGRHAYTLSLCHPSYSHSLCLRRDTQVFERAQRMGDVIQTESQHNARKTKPLLQVIHSTGRPTNMSQCCTMLISALPTTSTHYLIS